MTTWGQLNYVEAKELYLQGRYVEVIEYFLRWVRRSDNRDMVTSSFHLLKAWCHYYVEEYSSALGLALEIIKRFNESTSMGRSARILKEICEGGRDGQEVSVEPLEDQEWDFVAVYRPQVFF